LHEVPQSLEVFHILKATLPVKAFILQISTVLWLLSWPERTLPYPVSRHQVKTKLPLPAPSTVSRGKEVAGKDKLSDLGRRYHP
jgi:hypothetical protein